MLLLLMTFRELRGSISATINLRAHALSRAIISVPVYPMKVISRSFAVI